MVDEEGVQLLNVMCFCVCSQQANEEAKASLNLCLT